MSCEYSLAGLVAELCERAGLPFGKFNVTGLEGFVTGMQITNEASVAEHLQTLSEAYFFDPSQQGDVLSFVHRGADPVLTISEQDVIGDSTDEVKRKSPEEIVKVLNLNYYDADGAIDTDKQTSDRSIDTRGEGEQTLKTPLVLTTDFAARQVIIAHKVMIEEQRGDIDITLPNNYLSLTTADVVLFNGDRLRVDEVKLDAGEQRYTLKYDRKSAYASNAFGVAPIPLLPPVSTVPGATDIEFIDSPILASGDDSQLGYYLAISGSTNAWRGAAVELSLDGGQNFIESDTRITPAIMGQLLTPLNAASKYVPDGVNTVQVQINTFGVALESRTLAEMLNRQNRALVGDEVINFGNAEELEPGIWQLSYFLRGRLGSQVPASHAIGTRFILLERAFLDYVPSDIYNLGQPLTFRASSLNADTQTQITQTFNGNSQKELAPSYLRARKAGGQLIINWIGSGKLGGRARRQMGLYFTGYAVTVNGVTTNTQAQTLTMPAPVGVVTISVTQINSITGAGNAATITL